MKLEKYIPDNSKWEKMIEDIRKIDENDIVKIAIVGKYIKLEDYRHALEIPETYRYVDVRLHWIEKPIQELREKCQIDIQWTPIKDKENKRRVGSLEFTWKSVEQIEIPLEGGEKPKKKRGRKPKEA